MAQIPSRQQNGVDGLLESEGGSKQLDDNSLIIVSLHITNRRIIILFEVDKALHLDLR